MTEDRLKGTATVGGGCFWCVEAVFKRLKGVGSVTSGYAGGETPDPTYKQVCSGSTGHAEVVQAEYDPEIIDYIELLDVFFNTHDPTQLNRQGPDVGSQYRSIILYHDPEQKSAAESVIQRLDQSNQFEEEIVTEVVPFEQFYPADEKHQDYYEKHPDQMYCQAHIPPKLEKLEAAHEDVIEPS